MITRPLDLASKLRPEPRSLDWLFFVNAGLLVLFFDLFGSRFVLAPGLGVNEQTPVPQMGGAVAGARMTTHYITVVNARQILAGDGPRSDVGQLRIWLHEQAQTVKEPTLLVRTNGKVEMSLISEIVSVANAEGFHDVQVAFDDPQAPAKKGSR